MNKPDVHSEDVAVGCAMAVVWLVVFLANVAFWGFLAYLFYFWIVN